MTCKEIEDLLPGMIDGALPETEKKRIEAHLETCASCRKTFADLRISDERVKSLEEVEPPPWLKTRVMARVRAEAEQKEGFLRKFFYPLHIKVPIQALATVLIAVVAWNVYKTGEPEFRQMAPPLTTVREVPQVQTPPVPAAGIAKRDESPAAREKKAFAPPPAPGKEPAPQRAATVREETTADAEKPVERLKAAKRAAESPKDEDAWKGRGAARSEEADRVLEARARDQDQKQKALKAPVGAVAKEAGKQESRPAASPTMSAAVSSRPDLEITLPALDPGAAANEVETILKQVSAQAVERQAREGKVILTARIKTERLEALREKLKSLGPVQERVHAAPRPWGSLTIRIEIRPE